MFGMAQDRRDLEETAARVYQDWQDSPKTGKVWTRTGDIELDLGTPLGRFELLIYAILSGAKVQVSTVDRTFSELRKRGLTKAANLAAVEGDRIESIISVFRRHYRALTSRQRKADALVEAGVRVLAECAGDIGGAFQLVGGDSDRLLDYIRGFSGIDLRAYWFCREMKQAGIWPKVSDSVCLAVDAEIKLPLWYLGFVGTDSYYLRDVSTKECLQAIQNYFHGNPFPLLVKSRHWCQKGDSRLCAGQCRVYEHCQIRFYRSAGCL
ncbi:MAG: hypothetical protein H0Z38_00105 [Firmicutes bacterium]|nr:hypothetical protein [Bacillota bacterium]